MTVDDAADVLMRAPRGPYTVAEWGTDVERWEVHDAAGNVIASGLTKPVADVIVAGHEALDQRSDDLAEAAAKHENEIERLDETIEKLRRAAGDAREWITEGVALLDDNETKREGIKRLLQAAGELEPE